MIVEQDPFELQRDAERALLHGEYARADVLFREAATRAYTRDGANVLLERARDARRALEQQGLA